MSPITVRLIQSLMTDTCPDNTVCIDYGISTFKVLAALQWAYRHDAVGNKELEEALGDGPALTEIVQRSDKFGHINPHQCVIKTAWDNVPEEDE